MGGFWSFSPGERSAKVSKREHSDASAAPCAEGLLEPVSASLSYDRMELPLWATQTEGSLMNFAQTLSAPGGLGGSGSRREMGRYRGGLPVPKSLVLVHSARTNLTLSWESARGKASSYSSPPAPPAAPHSFSRPVGLTRWFSTWLTGRYSFTL